MRHTIQAEIRRSPANCLDWPLSAVYVIITDVLHLWQSLMQSVGHYLNSVLVPFALCCKLCSLLQENNRFLLNVLSMNDFTLICTYTVYTRYLIFSTSSLCCLEIGPRNHAAGSICTPPSPPPVSSGFHFFNPQSFLVILVFPWK
jgi:hypothetical protein